MVEAIVSLEFGQVQAVQLPEFQADQEVPVVLVDRVLVVLVDTVLAVLADRVLAEAVLAVLTDTVLEVQEDRVVLRSCDVVQIPRRNAANILNHSIDRSGPGTDAFAVDAELGGGRDELGEVLVEGLEGRDTIVVDASGDGWVEVVLKDFLPDL